MLWLEPWRHVAKQLSCQALLEPSIYMDFALKVRNQQRDGTGRDGLGIFAWFFLEVPGAFWQSSGRVVDMFWVGQPCPGFQSPPDQDHYIFRYINPELNLHLPLESWKGGQAKICFTTQLVDLDFFHHNISPGTLKLTASGSPWKWMVGIRFTFPFGRGLFSGRTC